MVNAGRRGDRIVADARSKAEQIVRQGETEAAMEMKKAQESIRREITDVSAAMAEKLLQTIEDCHAIWGKEFDAGNLAEK